MDKFEEIGLFTEKDITYLIEKAEDKGRISLRAKKLHHAEELIRYSSSAMGPQAPSVLYALPENATAYVDEELRIPDKLMRSNLAAHILKTMRDEVKSRGSAHVFQYTPREEDLKYALQTLGYKPTRSGIYIA